MPYLLISTEVRLENGPTLLGDDQLNERLISYLGAKLVTNSGNNFSYYSVEESPRIVLDKLASKGYRVVSSCGVGQTCVWTMFSETADM